MLRLNEPAPRLRLRNQCGIATGLTELHGHIVVMWWQRTFEHSIAEIIARSFRDRHADLTARNATILGISSDPSVRIARFHESLGLPFDLLSDVTGEAAAAYGAADWWRAGPDLPLTFVIDAGGLICASHQIDRGHANHVETLLADVARAAN